MEDFFETQITPKEGVNGRQPRGISISRLKPGNYYDAIKSQESDLNHHLPSIEEFHVIGEYAPFMLPLDHLLFSNNQLENNNVMGIVFGHPVASYNYESKEIPLEKNKSSYYILARIDY